MNRTNGKFSSVVIMAMSGKYGVFTKLCLHWQWMEQQL